MEIIFRQRKLPVNKGWRLDETYISVNGQWRYFYRAVDKEGHTIDFLLTAQRDLKAARRFLDKAIQQNGLPITITLDKSAANKDMVEQDHRFIKRIVRPMMGF